MATPRKTSARSGNPAVRADGTRIEGLPEPQDHQPAKRTTKKAASGGPAATITIEAEPRKKYPIELVGVRYNVSAPKSALAIKMAEQARDPKTQADALQSLREWVGIAFGKEAAKVNARLDDPNDELDIDHIMVLMNRLAEVETGTPTTSR